MLLDLWHPKFCPLAFCVAIGPLYLPIIYVEKSSASYRPDQITYWLFLMIVSNIDIFIFFTHVVMACAVWVASLTPPRRKTESNDENLSRCTLHSTVTANSEATHNAHFAAVANSVALHFMVQIACAWMALLQPDARAFLRTCASNPFVAATAYGPARVVAVVGFGASACLAAFAVPKLHAEAVAGKEDAAAETGSFTTAREAYRLANLRLSCAVALALWNAGAAVAALCGLASDNATVSPGTLAATAMSGVVMYIWVIWFLVPMALERRLSVGQFAFGMLYAQLLGQHVLHNVIGWQIVAYTGAELVPMTASVVAGVFYCLTPFVPHCLLWPLFEKYPNGMEDSSDEENSLLGRQPHSSGGADSGAASVLLAR